MTRHYTLPPSEIHRLFEAGGPVAELQLDPEKLKHMQICVAEVDGQIVGYWILWYALHLEPLWIQEAHRRSPKVIKGLVKEMEAAFEASGEPAGFAIIEHANMDAIATQAERLGFLQAPGSLFYVVKRPVEEPVGV